MFTSFLLQLLLFSVSLIPNSSAQSAHDTVTDPTKRAEYAFTTLQTWYNASTGIWDSTGWWNSANIMTMVGNLAKTEPKNQRLQKLAARIFANTVMQAPAKNPQPGIENEASRGQDVNKTFALSNRTDPEDWLDGFYDDDLWWALAWINAYDITSNPKYLHLAEGIFAAVTKAWPTRCGNGGIFWSWEEEYMNAIANELFMSTAAHLANRMDEEDRKKEYVAWAERTLDWFLSSGMINERGTINDGLTEDCENNDRTTWSYNQGVILGALVQLNKATPNPTYLALAACIAKAAIIELSDVDGVIHDICEPECGGDGTQFKGIFIRNLQILHEAAPDDAYAEVININAESIWVNDRDGNAFSVNWAGPFVRPANASTQSSAMDALVAAIAVH
ncbi:glycoside hydrolase family 76 protein [Cucurbitaria berberidis CBS 394.84]|uniref:Glycoside hydrolase family 76 protein n=1 Tax=Cucurbitaria berberidis CBS 394.84 TaxID=1168544 RepID=A0A9P4GPZ3_9PLEO|nr:glycoside hydrolase family 76 protein [Cucurbitaria berberidis CBS 394.84]KAF1849271.1 glycoside hydrolase family 76 protein [Cucurbitaria berberidis CBS 394.84]